MVTAKPIGIVATALLAWLAIAAVASAQPTLTLGPDAPPLAEQRYQIALRLYAEGQYAAAAREFRVALKIVPGSARLAYNLARSLERAGDTGPAIDAYERYLERAPQAADRADVEKVLAVLREELVQAEVVAEVSTVPTGARLYLDDAPTPSGTSPIALRLRPGPHRVRAELAGHERVRRTLEAVAGVPLAVEITLPVLAGAPEPPAADSTVAPAPETGWRPVTGWSLVGAGALATALGVYFTLEGVDAADGSEGLGPQDDARRADLEDQLGGAELGMGLGYGLGAAMIGTGIVLLLWPDESGASARVVRTRGRWLEVAW